VIRRAIKFLEWLTALHNANASLMVATLCRHHNNAFARPSLFDTSPLHTVEFYNRRHNCVCDKFSDNLLVVTMLFPRHYLRRSANSSRPRCDALGNTCDTWRVTICAPLYRRTCYSLTIPFICICRLLHPATCYSM